MTEENLLNIKRKYREMNEINNNLSSLLEIKERMESLEIVKQYLKVLETLSVYQENFPINREVLNPQELLEHVIKSETITDTNKIYVYQSSFAKYSYGKDKQSRGYKQVAYNDESAEFHIYLDLEKEYNQAVIEVSANEREIFEKENKIIYPGVNQYAFDCYKEKREMFYKTAIFENQEKAILKVLSKDNNL